MKWGAVSWAKLISLLSAYIYMQESAHTAEMYFIFCMYFLQIINHVYCFQNYVSFTDHKLCFVAEIVSTFLCVRTWPKSFKLLALFQLQSVLEKGCFMRHLWVTYLPCLAFCPPFSNTVVIEKWASEKKVGDGSIINAQWCHNYNTKLKM